MSLSVASTIITVAYGILLFGWLVSLPSAKRAFKHQPATSTSPATVHPPMGTSSWLTARGTLLVFVANIVSIAIVVISTIAPEVHAFVERTRFHFPSAVNLLGAVLFLLHGLWGTLVLVFNPSYTPFFQEPKHPLRLATRGPYAVVRHPRYAAEAALNLILPLFTGVWLSVFGVLGWSAMSKQAQAEEVALTAISPAEYGRYTASVGMFWPRIGALRRK